MDAPYQRLADELRRRVTSGDWPPGARIPSTRALVEEYHVSRGLVQLAVRALRREGVLEGRPGARLTVAYPPAVRTLTDPDTAWPHGVGDTASGSCRPSEELATRLGVGARVRLAWERRELLDPDGRPAMLVTEWWRGRPGRHVEVACELRPHVLAPEEASALGLAVSAPALLVERSRLGVDGRPVQVADLVLPADRWRVSLRASVRL